MSLRIAALRLLCPNPAVTAAFYARAFGCHAEPEDDRLHLALGAQWVELAPTDAPEVAPAPAQATSFQHFAIAVADMAAAYAHLRTVPGWSAISQAGPETLPPASGGVSAFKFRDPDGHPLELLRFLDGSVPERWRNRHGLFLGIDHTAITVADTGRSVAFYAGLGFTTLSRGVNRGAEQARLDAVAAPVVEVTALRPPGGAPPHLELLCYREPGPLAVQVADDAVLATRIVVSGPPDTPLGERGGSDPDGHRLVIEEAFGRASLPA